MKSLFPISALGLVGLLAACAETSAPEPEPAQVNYPTTCGAAPTDYPQYAEQIAISCAGKPADYAFTLIVAE